MGRVEQHTGNIGTASLGAAAVDIAADIAAITSNPATL
jgi:hypothetical protein